MKKSENKSKKALDGFIKRGQLEHMKTIQIQLSEDEAEIIGSALLRDIRTTRQAIENGSVEMFPNEYRLRLQKLRNAFAALGEAKDIQE